MVKIPAAKVIKEFTIGGTGGRPDPYPWEEWVDGKYREVSHGQQFTCPVSSFVNGLHNRARTMGMKAETRTDKKSGLVQFRFFKERKKPGRKAMALSTLNGQE